MKITSTEKWVYYTADNYYGFDPKKVGKWMYFYYDVNQADAYCRRAVDNCITNRAKHSNATSGICGFYVDIGDNDGHRRVIKFLLDNDLVRRTASGRLFDIAFKYEVSDYFGDFGEATLPKLKLSDFVDLDSGEMLPTADYVQESFL